MKQKLRNILVALAIVLSGTMMLVPVTAHATFKTDACQGINTLSGTGSTDCSKTADSSINKLMTTVIQIFSVIVGFVAVLMVIVGGLRFITANGDSGATASARNTIIYALIGLLIVAFAQLLVHFVIHKTT